MKGKLFQCEMRKLLFSFRGFLLILIFLLLKTSLLCFLPELKDSRIKLSQNQYNTILATIEGETTEEKEQYIEKTYAQYQSIVEQYAYYIDEYMNGRITEESWKAFAAEYAEASLYSNAFSIFMDKVEQFRLLQPLKELPPPAFFYEYGWNSALTYMSYPDPLSVLLVVLLSVQLIAPETMSGALSIILTTKNGRRTLFLSKLSVLLAVLCAVAGLSAAEEAALFTIRFSLTNGHWPIYSISSYSANALNLTLSQGMLGLAVIRGLGLIFTGLITWTMACLFGNVSHTMFCALALVALPWMFLPDTAFSLSAWLSGKPMLVSGLWLPAAVGIGIITALLLRLAYRVRFQTGTFKK